MHQLSQFAQHTAEVLAGERPPGQMRNLFCGAAYERLVRRAGGYASSVQRPCVSGTVMRNETDWSVFEVSAVVACGTRHRALAMRVVFAQHAWLCTHIETDLERGRRPCGRGGVRRRGHRAT
ncbi:Rv3235 family protein [Nocardiopsis gilva]|uniref:Rv3235 family protein n=1 Tax=Nocardiopsis gilva TaxID=280236 RepID=UPI000345222E|nr:Rv3235 family protein [Nocardiopsis gilva]